MSSGGSKPPMKRSSSGKAGASSRLSGTSEKRSNPPAPPSSIGTCICRVERVTQVPSSPLKRTLAAIGGLPWLHTCTCIVDMEVRNVPPPQEESYPAYESTTQRMIYMISSTCTCSNEYSMYVLRNCMMLLMCLAKCANCCTLYVTFKV